MKKHALVFIPAMLLSMLTEAGCPPPPVSAAPVIPDGSVATADVMYEAQEQVADYVVTIEDYLECRGNRLPYALSDFRVRQVEQIAQEYNVELREFRARQQEIVQN